MTAPRLVICDDHQIFGESLAALLEARGFDVVSVTSDLTSGLAAVRRFQADLCILDIGFPDGSGLDVIGDIVTASPHCRVLILSATTDGRTVQQAIAVGALGFAGKNQPVADILRTVARVAAGEVAFPVDALRSAMSTATLSDAQRLALHLTPREREVLEHLVRGFDTRSLARDLGITYSTARTHVQNVLSKLGVHSRLEAACLAIRESMVDLEQQGVRVWPGPEQYQRTRSPPAS